MAPDENPQAKIEATIDQRVAQLFREDAGKHREFLQSMFKTITWAIGVLILFVAAAGTWMFGKSVESAAGEQVKKFMNDEGVPDRLRAQVDSSFNKAIPGLRTEADKAVKRALNDETGRTLDLAVKRKIEEIKKLQAQDLIQQGLRGPMGPPGPKGDPGPPGPPGSSQVHGATGQGISNCYVSTASDWSDKPTYGQGSVARCREGETALGGACVVQTSKQGTNSQFILATGRPVGYECITTQGSQDRTRAQALCCR